ncbi:MAG: TIGR03790 family protein [Bryobacteraceae bacterium]
MPSRIWGIGVALVCCGSGAEAFAGGPEAVLVVVNSSSAASREIGSYYASRRSIPARNICRLAMTDAEAVSRVTYDQEIARPVMQFLRSQELVEKIQYIVTTSGVPLRIRGSGGIDGDGAAVDSEMTLLYQRLHGQRPPIAGAIANPYFARGDPFQHPDFPIYLVTRLAAWDVDGVKKLIDRGLDARNTGRVVLDQRADGSDQGDQWLREAARGLPSDRVVLDDSTRVVSGLTDVIGYASWGSNDRANKARAPHFQWLPGGLATEYVSTDGRTFQRPPASWGISTWADADKSKWFAGSPQSLTADLLADGATGASGHVDEPFLAYTPRPNLLFPAYLAGRNLAESYYTAIPRLSWQNIVIGDPLVRLR